ncbi:hypothetical protein TCAL_00159 [Tigriopus californicus]|uniref:C2H2-type domain-containing protein n=1 Tax=Tigriopus californicus TaxID=6832 RepID=A0A553PGA1_TIGCA|nr:zinc finger matrin-type protein 3-like [Tigriopus californicus]TRY76700.1 hypothetical protein TCAL_00159 [Tigriopus californicus]|eukprot:TCALIF_00159-PA protein Name:"Similar to ZMAT3 Zinc finger matrin-type protein 3 (Homo sapiens)" AED:0.00 eAED:0.00 QI:390/1/1/1/0/0/2/76/371
MGSEPHPPSTTVQVTFCTSGVTADSLAKQVTLPAVNPESRPVLHRILNEPHWQFLHAWIGACPEPPPESLLRQCQPFYCGLCAVRINARDQAQHHYNGQTHAKRSRSYWLAQVSPCSAKGGKRLGSEQHHWLPTKKAKGRGDPQAMFCQICSCGFTSPKQVDIHMAGRNHRRKMAGLPELKRGYFNSKTGGWQREPRVLPELDPSNATARNPHHLITLTPDSPGSSGPSVRTPDVNGPFFCGPCQVSATSQMQLDLHLKGKNHKKVVKRLDLSPPTAPLRTVKPPTANVPLSGVDFSSFRTPSGQYYCAPCNVSLNSASQFGQHTSSKKHRQTLLANKVKASQVKRKPPIKASSVFIVKRPQLVAHHGRSD